jgi:hypothetical protein
MDAKIFSSEARHVATVQGTEIFNLSGKKLYDLRGAKIYKTTGELVGHLTANRLDKASDKLFEKT